MKFLICLFLLTSTISALHGQSQKSLFLKVNTFSLLDPVTPGLQIGTEYKINNNWAVECTYGIPWYVGRNWSRKDSNYHNNKKIKLELKRFFGKRSEYLAGEFFYTHNKYKSFNDWYSDNSGSYFYKEALFKKNIFGFAFKLGQLYKISQKIYLDAFFSLGVRNVDTNVKATDSNLGVPPFQEWVRADEPLGTRITPHTAFGIKFSCLIF